MFAKAFLLFRDLRFDLKFAHHCYKPSLARISLPWPLSSRVRLDVYKVTRPLWLVVLAGQHGHTVMVTYPYAYMTYIVSPLAGLCGGISWRLPACRLFSARTNCIYVLRNNVNRRRVSQTL